MRIQSLALSLAAAAALVCGAALERTRADEAAIYKVGAKVEDATVKDIDGKDVSLASLKGKVVLLNFFSWKCVICNGEAPKLEKDIWPKYKDRGVVVVGVARTPEDAKKMRERHGLTYTLWSDRDAVLFERFVDQAIPWNAVIDAEGVIRYTKVGFDESEVVKVLDEVLAPKKKG